MNTAARLVAAVSATLALAACSGADTTTQTTTTAGAASTATTAQSPTTTSTTETTGTTGTTATTVADPVTLCGRVDPAAVTAVLGAAPDGAPQTTGPVTECVWAADDDTTLSVTEGTGDLTEVLSIASNDDTVQERVDGVGDSAYYLSGYSSFDTATTQGLSLWVRRGEVTYVVSARTGVTPPAKAQLRAIAEGLLG